MAVETDCMTDGANYTTVINSKMVSVSVKMPFNLILSEKEATQLQDNLHNAIELVLAPHFLRNKMRGSGE
jgi:hypothetical protein